MDAGVVEKEHYAWAIEGATISESLEQLLEEVLEHGCIDTSFNQLRTDDRVLGDTCDQTDRVVLRPLLDRWPYSKRLGCKAVPAEVASALVASQL